MSIGNTVIDLMFKKGFLGKVRNQGIYFNNELNKLKFRYPKIIKEIRGLGLLVGIKIGVNQNEFIEKLIKNKLLTVKAAENVVRLLPPLNVNKREIDEAVEIINKVCKSYK